MKNSEQIGGGSPIEDYQEQPISTNEQHSEKFEDVERLFSEARSDELVDGLGDEFAPKGERADESSDEVVSEKERIAEISENKRIAKIRELFDQFKTLDEGEKDELMKRHLHSLFFSLLRRREVHAINNLGNEITKTYRFDKIYGYATMGALAEGYQKEKGTDNKMAEALLALFLATASNIGSGDLRATVRGAIALAERQKIHAAESLKEIYLIVCGGSYMEKE